MFWDSESKGAWHGWVLVEKKAEVGRGKKDEGKVNKSRRMEEKSCEDYPEEDAEFAFVHVNSYFILPDWHKSV